MRQTRPFFNNWEKRSDFSIDNIEQMAQPSEGYNKLIRQGITAGFKQLHKRHFFIEII